MTAQIGFDQMVGDDRGFRRRAAAGRDDLVGERKQLGVVDFHVVSLVSFFLIGRFAKGGTNPYAVSTTSSITKASMPDLRKVTIASIGVQTIGSLSLKDVLMTRGTPVMVWKAEINS